MAPKVQEVDYEVKLGVFEGPLDLLLYLVTKNELDPRRIPIAVITDQYLQYLETMQSLNLGNAGEFLVMAARLMRLKTRELLPADEKDELEEMEYELDREALIKQMLEYQKFKEAARSLRGFEERNYGALGRGRPDTPVKSAQTEWEEEAGIFDLLSAFRAVLRQKPPRTVHEVEIDDVTIEDRMQAVDTLLHERGRCLFEDLFAEDSRVMAKVVTFMAILELCKLDRIVLRQERGLSAIWAYRKKDNRDFSLEMDRDETHVEELPELKAGLVEIVKEQIRSRSVEVTLESTLQDLQREILGGEGGAPARGAGADGIPPEAASGEETGETEAAGETVLAEAADEASLEAEAGKGSASEEVIEDGTALEKEADEASLEAAAGQEPPGPTG